jgi:N-acetylglucosaminyl-diphospho-decaprenol L-rhamnosyltransferase
VTDRTPPGPTVSILVVSFNTAADTVRCLASIREHCSLSHEVLVLDNGSDDDSVAQIRSTAPEVALTVSPTNLGFGAAVNRLANRASGRWLLLLNPDARLVDDSIDRLISFAEDNPDHGSYGGRSIDEDGETDPRSALGIPTLWSHICFGLLLSTLFESSRHLNPEGLGGWDRSTVREVGATTGCFMAVDRMLWKELGGFDERYFVYGEDVDLAMRMRARGLTPIFTPDAKVVHEWGAASSSTRRLELILRGKVTLARTHLGRVARTPAVAMLFLGVALRAVLARSSPTPWASALRDRSWLEGHPAPPAAVGSSSENVASD